MRILIHTSVPASPSQVRILGGGGNGTSSNATSNATAFDYRAAVVVALTPARPPSEVTADDARCDVVLNTTEGREALGWFTYNGLPPPACRVLNDIDLIDWNSIPEMISLYLCVWPWALTALVALSALRLLFTVRRRSQSLRKLKLRVQAREARARSERRVREEPL